MGIPYSREINSAFEQVTPLVASAYEVLQTTKNIAILLAWIQITTVVLLTLILLALVGLLFTMNPDLDKERKAIVTPVMKWVASWVLKSSGTRKSIAGLLIILFALSGFGFLAYVYYVRNVEDATVENEVGGDVTQEKRGKDVDALKKGDTKQ